MKKPGEQSVMTSGLRRMPMLPANKLASQSLVSEKCLNVWTRKEAVFKALRNDIHGRSEYQGCVYTLVACLS